MRSQDYIAVQQFLSQKAPDSHRTDAGIEAAPHDLRHTLETMLREQGYGLSIIAEILGHASIDVTARYILATEVETAAALEILTVEG
ncbi:MAG: tyrosine-type recombinase/integrase [Pseudonocardiaceae bacterium]